MTPTVEQLILKGLEDNKLAIRDLDGKVDNLALAVEHRVTKLETSTRYVSKRAGAYAGGIVAAVVAAVASVISALIGAI
jgi:hypothetical protein